MNDARVVHDTRAACTITSVAYHTGMVRRVRRGYVLPSVATEGAGVRRSRPPSPLTGIGEGVGSFVKDAA